MEILALAQFSALKKHGVAVRCLRNRTLNKAFFRIVASICGSANFYIFTVTQVAFSSAFFPLTMLSTTMFHELVISAY
jgi:hypothetical protein